MATVTICEPEAMMESSMSRFEANLPVPTKRREVNSRPPIFKRFNHFSSIKLRVLGLQNSSAHGHTVDTGGHQCGNIFGRNAAYSDNGNCHPGSSDFRHDGCHSGSSEYRREILLGLSRFNGAEADVVDIYAAKGEDVGGSVGRAADYSVRAELFAGLAR